MLSFPPAAVASMSEGALAEHPVVQTPLMPAQHRVTLAQTHLCFRNWQQKLPSSKHLEPRHVL